MQLQQRINAFATLGSFLGQFASEGAIKNPQIPANESYFERMLQQLQSAKDHNGWFTRDNLRFACASWSEALSEENLKKWTSKYNFKNGAPKTIAVIMAGNIPLVGFHDFISVLISGNQILIKQSSNDDQILPLLSEYLQIIEPQFQGRITITKDKLSDFDAVIATGSNNTARYFDHYFSRYPHIIRKNRNSVAVLTGGETPAQLQALADDIFTYFGLGCRNVSKLFVPEDYNFDDFFNAVFEKKDIIQHNKYINNYDYNKAVYLMSGIQLLDNEFLLLKEDASYSSPISVVFYEYYSDTKSLRDKLAANSERIQCIVSDSGISNEINFGKAQTPQLWDYADGVDTLDFLLKLS
ncbi:acyl-CoA reductase [Constantimarinum furrinae]|nr:acyl-CoA reductase [Constantimarinum furrinae]